MKKVHLIIMVVSVLVNYKNGFSQENKTFSTAKEVFDFAKKNYYLFVNSVLQTQLADVTSKIAVGNVFNPKVPSSIQMVNNIAQQVNFLPGQAFGMPIGTFKEVIIGQQYVSTLNIQPQLDILNMANLVQIKTAKINKQLVENQNAINEQLIFDKINALYFNILAFQAQKEIILKNIATAEQIKLVVTSKLNEGIARKQELNEADVNLILIQDKLNQIEYNIKIQYQTLGLLIGNQQLPVLTQSLTDFEKVNLVTETQNTLQAKNAQLQSLLAEQEYKSIKYQNLPVISFQSSLNWQNLSHDNFFTANSQWIDYRYVGLKLSYDFPTTVQKVSNLQTKKIQLEILKHNEEEAMKETETKNKLLILEYQKSLEQLSFLKKIYDLKHDTYDKNLNQFKEGILALDKLIISQNDLLNSEVNVVSALSSIGFNKTKIEINNGFKDEK